MNEDKHLIIHFNDGTKFEFSLPAQIRNSTAAVMERIKRIMESDKLARMRREMASGRRSRWPACGNGRAAGDGIRRHCRPAAGRRALHGADSAGGLCRHGNLASVERDHDPAFSR